MFGFDTMEPNRTRERERVVGKIPSLNQQIDAVYVWVWESQFSVYAHMHTWSEATKSRRAYTYTHRCDSYVRLSSFVQVSVWLCVCILGIRVRVTVTHVVCVFVCIKRTNIIINVLTHLTFWRKKKAALCYSVSTLYQHSHSHTHTWYMFVALIVCSRSPSLFFSLSRSLVRSPGLVCPITQKCIGFSQRRVHFWLMRDSTVKISRSPPFLPYTDKTHNYTRRKYINRAEWRAREQQKSTQPTNQKKETYETWGRERHDGCRKKLIIIWIESVWKFWIFSFVCVYYRSDWKVYCRIW